MAVAVTFPQPSGAAGARDTLPAIALVRQAPQVMPVSPAAQPPDGVSSGATSVANEVRWAVPLSSAPLAGAVIAGGHVFVSLRSGHIVAYRAADGVEAWRVELSAEQPLAALDGLVFVAAGEAVHALRVGDGAVAWRAAAGTLTAPPLARDGWVIASAGTKLMALRASDGTVVWTRESGAIAAQPSIEGDWLYLPLADGRVQSLVLATGADRWTRRLGGAPTEVLAFADRVFVGSTDRYLYALAARDGAIAWRYRVGAALRGRPAHDGSLVYIAALDNLVRGFDRGNGAQKWDAAVRYRPTAGPLVAGGTVLVAGPARELSTFDTVTGALRASFTLPAPLAAPLTSGTLAEGPVLVALVGDASVGWTVALLGPRFGLRLAPLSALPGEVVPIQIPRIAPPPK